MQSLIGERAVPFTLTDTDGATIDLRDYRDRWLLMVFHRHLG